MRFRDLNDPLQKGYVSYIRPDKTVIYGEADVEHPEFEKYLAKGMLLIADCILPKTYALYRQALTPANLDDVLDHKEAEIEKAYKQNEVNNFQVAIGTVFSVHVGDGAAHYVITKVNKKSCKVEWRGYGYDSYYDRVLGGGGTFPISRIEPLIVKRPAVFRKRSFRFDGKPMKETK